MSVCGVGDEGRLNILPSLLGLLFLKFHYTLLTFYFHANQNKLTVHVTQSLEETDELIN